MADVQDAASAEVTPAGTREGDAAAFVSSGQPAESGPDSVGQKVFETIVALRLQQGATGGDPQGKFHLGQLSFKWLKDKRQPQIYLSNGIESNQHSSNVFVHALLPENTQFLHLQTPASGFGSETMSIKDAALNVVLDVAYPSEELLSSIKLEVAGTLATPAMWSKMSRRMTMDFLRYWDDHVPQHGIDDRDKPGPTLVLRIDRGEKHWPAPGIRTGADVEKGDMGGHAGHHARDSASSSEGQSNDAARPGAARVAVPPLHMQSGPNRSPTESAGRQGGAYRHPMASHSGRRAGSGYGAGSGSEHGRQDMYSRHGYSARSAPSLHGSARSEWQGESREGGQTMEELRARIAYLEQRGGQVQAGYQAQYGADTGSPAYVQPGPVVARAGTPSAVSDSMSSSRRAQAPVNVPVFIPQFNGQGPYTHATVDMSKAVPLSYLTGQDPSMAYAGYPSQGFMPVGVQLTPQQAMMAYAGAMGQMPPGMSMPQPSGPTY